MRISRRQLSRLIREEFDKLKEIEVMGHDVSTAPPPNEGLVEFAGAKWEVTTKAAGQRIKLSVDAIEKVDQAIKVKVSAFSDNKWLRQDREGYIKDPAAQKDLVEKLASNVSFELKVEDPEDGSVNSLDFVPVA